MTWGKRPMSKTSLSTIENLKKSLHFHGGLSSEEECIGVHDLDVLEGLVEDSSSLQNLSRVHALELESSSETHLFSFKYIMLTLVSFYEMLCQV